MAHSLLLISKRNNWEFDFWSAYDTNDDLMHQYLPAKNFNGFGTNRIMFVVKSIISAAKPDIIILSHINLAIIGLLIKIINPGCKVWLVAHGIEVWRPQSIFKRSLLKKCDKIICVSNFTKQQMISRHRVAPEICSVLNNTIDPFMKLPETFTKPAGLIQRYKLNTGDPVIFTLTRLASYEQYKGHDQVIKAVAKLKLVYPDIKYILSGKYDIDEEIRINNLIDEYRVRDNVILTGFIDEKELPDHFLLADIFVLPSKKEGFGIVFIEALACGLPVICGNADGSIDAICNGKLGKAINADNIEELEQAIIDYLKMPLTDKRRKDIQQQCLSHFNETDYMNKLEKLITA